MATLMLLPGLDGTGELFAPFVAALRSEFVVRVVRYPSTKPLSYESLESVAHAALPSDGPYVVLGESFSGPIAISLAAAASPQLKGLILCCSFARNPRPVFAPLRSLVNFLPVKLAPIALLSHLLLGRFSTTALRSALIRALAQVSTAALRARMRAILSVNASAQLRSVTVPVLYLRASQDRLVPARASAQIVALAPHARVVELEAPHFLLQAAPSEAAEVVRAFVHEVHAAV